MSHPLDNLTAADHRERAAVLHQCATTTTDKAMAGYLVDNADLHDLAARLVDELFETRLVERIADDRELNYETAIADLRAQLAATVEFNRPGSYGELPRVPTPEQTNTCAHCLGRLGSPYNYRDNKPICSGCAARP